MTENEALLLQEKLRDLKEAAAMGFITDAEMKVGRNFVLRSFGRTRGPTTYRAIEGGGEAAARNGVKEENDNNEVGEADDVIVLKERE